NMKKLMGKRRLSSPRFRKNLPKNTHKMIKEMYDEQDYSHDMKESTNVFFENDIKTEEIKNDNIKTEELKNDNIKTEEIKNDNINTEEIKNDNINIKEIKNNINTSKEIFFKAQLENTIQNI
ncbi:ag-1 blood stage membrane protein-like protein, partial [Plasmodium gaboni]